MELEHRFEVPVGISKAWPALLNMELVAPCFPGASLETVNGDEFTGSVKIKLGPIQLNYKGKAKIVEKDEQNHRAVIEANGNAARSASTATMLVTATATSVAPNRTAVDLVTTLAITGRPAQFGRGVMVEVGNKLIGQFADNIAKELTGKSGNGVTLVGVVNPDEVAAKVSTDEGLPTVNTPTVGAHAAVEDPAAAGHATADTAKAASSAGGTAPFAGGTAPSGSPRRITPPSQATEPIDLLESAGAPVLKRLAPLVAALLVVFLIVQKLRKKKS